MQIKLTKANVDRHCLPPTAEEVNRNGKPIRQHIYWDSELPGFGVVVGSRRKTFIAQRPVNGKTVRTSIGPMGVYTPDEARKQARQLLQEMANGVNPNQRQREQADAQAQAEHEAEWRAFTLRQAMDEHIANLRAENRSERTIELIRYEIPHYLGEWLDKPLADIRPSDCLDRHREITEQHGPVTANRTMRMLRACWNSARARYEELPEHPIKRAAGGRPFPWNKTKRKRQPIPWDELPAWAERVDRIANPIRRDFQWFVLLTGLRSEDARTVRWEHVNFDEKTLYRPSPKGGEDRAFTLPLSDALVAILQRRWANNEMDFGYSDRGWVWPTWSGQGRVTYMREAKEQDYWKDNKSRWRKRNALPTPHRLRDTWASAANEAGVGLIAIKVLMNHSLPEADVTQGYIRPSGEYLRQAQECVTAFLLAKAGRESYVQDLTASP